MSIREKFNKFADSPVLFILRILGYICAIVLTGILVFNKFSTPAVDQGQNEQVTKVAIDKFQEGLDICTYNCVVTYFSAGEHKAILKECPEFGLDKAKGVIIGGCIARCLKEAEDGREKFLKTYAKESSDAVPSN
jgi:hypothetical protein